MGRGFQSMMSDRATRWISKWLIRALAISLITIIGPISQSENASAVLSTPTPSCTTTTCTITFTNTTDVYQWTNPGLAQITVTLKGGSGGYGSGASSTWGGSGPGGVVSGTLNVSGVASLSIYVGNVGQYASASSGSQTLGGLSGGLSSGGGSLRGT